MTEEQLKKAEAIKSKISELDRLKTLSCYGECDDSFKNTSIEKLIMQSERLIPAENIDYIELKRLLVLAYEKTLSDLEKELEAL